MKIQKQIESLIPKVEETEKTEPRLKKNLDERVSDAKDINFKKYPSSFRGDSLLDD